MADGQSNDPNAAGSVGVLEVPNPQDASVLGPTDEAGTRSTEDGSATSEGSSSQTDQIPKWHSSLPKDLQGDPTLLSYESAEDAWRGFKEVNTKMGSMIALPGEKATEEERSRFTEQVAAHMGKPETQDGYQFETVDPPEGMESWPNDDISAFAGIAHELNLTQEQANELQKWYMGSMGSAITRYGKSQATAESEALVESERQLKKEWGSDYDKNNQLANRTIVKYPEMTKFVIDNKLTKYPEVRKFFATLGAEMGEGGSPRDESIDSQGLEGGPRFRHLKEYEAGRTGTRFSE